MTKKYEPSAFPNPRWEGWGEPEKGMTLRDYFAAKAMQAVFSQIFIASQANGTTPEKLAELKATGAYICYSMADAMLKTREVDV
jgi:hypothetical protein